jgi:hypothetical protein
MHFISLLARSRTALAAEKLFLRKQLAFYRQRKVRPRRFDNVTRLILVLLSHGFAWKGALVNVTARTFIGWHRAGFRLFWRWKSRPGQPPIPIELRRLIREMARSNPSWGEQRIANELLLKLGIRISPRTVHKYMPKRPRGGPRHDQRWSTFVRNPAAAILACDGHCSGCVTLSRRTMATVFSSMIAMASFRPSSTNLLRTWDCEYSGRPLEAPRLTASVNV